MPSYTHVEVEHFVRACSRFRKPQKMQENTLSLSNETDELHARVGRQGRQSWARMRFICFGMDSGMSLPVPEKFSPHQLRSLFVSFRSLSLDPAFMAAAFSIIASPSLSVSQLAHER
jgi:hypothetical protein